jgi:hypothetical protein
VFSLIRPIPSCTRNVTLRISLAIPNPEDR